MTLYYIAWSPFTGEATYTSCFTTAEEREKYANRIYAKSVRTWEATISAR